MSELWINHLSSFLSEQQSVAYIWDTASDSLEWGGDVYKVLGIRKQDLPKSKDDLSKWINPQDLPGRMEQIHSVLNNKHEDMSGTYHMEYRMRHSKGHNITIKEKLNLHHDEDTDSLYICGFLTPMGHTKEKDQENQANEKASKSRMGEITTEETVRLEHAGGQPFSERLMLQQAIDRQLEKAKDTDVQHSGYVLTVGIDHMRLHNEVLGCRSADELIEKTGDILGQISGDRSRVFRVNGDVFAIYQPDHDPAEMPSMAHHIIQKFNVTQILTETGESRASVSIGGRRIAATEDSGETMNGSKIIMHSETALVAAKEKGRNCFVSYADIAELTKEHKMHLKAVDDFLNAFKEDRMFLAFQPIVDAKTRETLFYESLIRFRNKDGKIIVAGQLIESIEKLGLIRLVDQFAFQKAIEEMIQYPDLSLSVNVSRMTLTNPEWLRNLVYTLRDKPSVAKRLIIELTETAVVDDLDHMERVIKTVKDMGCRVALDDFGVGYTAFSYIRLLDVDIVKIDKSFVRNAREEGNRLFIKTLTTLAEGLNAQTIAEGVETMSDADTMEEENVTMLQGYAYGFPKIERLWLPKDHVHRKIDTECVASAEADDKQARAQSSEKSA